MDGRVEVAGILTEVTSIARLVFSDPALELSQDTISDDIPAWDSMSHITLLVEIESRFCIQFDIAQIEELKSVGELVNAIDAKLALVRA